MQAVTGKIGLGVITYRHQERFEQSIATIPWGLLDEIVVVNDGTPYPTNSCPLGVHHIQHEENRGVGAAKNSALEYLLSTGCEHIFLMEDDLLIKNAGVFNAYIRASQTTGIQHFNFSLQGKENRDSMGRIAPLQCLDYNGVPTVALYGRCLACFSYFSRRSIQDIPLHNLRFENAWEHVELTYRIAERGMHPPFHWYADIIDSDRYLATIKDSELDSTIRSNPEWDIKVIRGAQVFKELHGVNPILITHAPIEQALDSLRSMKILYGQ